MWLIDVQSFKLRYFQDASQVAQKYAILSHRWEDEEVSHSDMTSRWDRLRLKRMKGWYKIQKCCEQAAKDDLSYAWVDTCCIDKTSSAELQEAINSMFTWYSEAKICYVFLSDVADAVGDFVKSSRKSHLVLEQFQKSQWFTRGWTLQELLAPKAMKFYDCQWRGMGSRTQHKDIISDITGIESKYLDGFDPAWTFNTQICIAQVMAWASGRKTTRVEDKAYSLLGIFGVSLPMLYGEGRRAFNRLQEELLRSRDDQSIFAWTAREDHPTMAIALTDSPDDFVRTPKAYRWLSPSEMPRRKPHIVSSDGISLDLLMRPVQPGLYHAFLNAGMINTELQHLLTPEYTDDIAEDGTIILKAIAFPIKEIGPEGYFVRFVPNQQGGVVYYAPSQRGACVLRRVTLSSFLKIAEYEEASTEDSASFKILKTVSDLWGFSNVHDVIDQPEEWPRQASEARVIKGEKAQAVAGILVWDGWPHKLFWGYHRLPIAAIAFGYDFEFNPTCLVVAGRMTYDEQMSQRLRAGMMHNLEDDKTQFRVNDYQKLIIEGGTCGLLHFDKGEGPSLVTHDEDRDSPILFILKTTSTTRRSGKGFHATFYLRNSEYDHYHRARIHVVVNRTTKTVPWQIDIGIEREKTEVVDKRVAPDYTRFVQSRPAHLLGSSKK